jgi:hypothetical protein
MNYAVLIDAGFMNRMLGSQMERLDVNGVCAFLASLRAAALTTCIMHIGYA